jgi:hypothetical protein
MSWGESRSVLLSLELSPREGAPLLERCGALQEEAAYLLRGGAPLAHSFLPCVKLIGVGERWQPHLSHLASISSPSGAPSLLGKCAPPYKIKHSLLCKLVGVFEKNAIVICYCTIFHYWNKRLWRLFLVIKLHVWISFVKLCLIVR